MASARDGNALPACVLFRWEAATPAGNERHDTASPLKTRVPCEDCNVRSASLPWSCPPNGRQRTTHLGRTGRTHQIKGRCMCRTGSQANASALSGRRKEWDAVLMVLLDKDPDAIGDRRSGSGGRDPSPRGTRSGGRNERDGGSKFQSIGRLRWRRP